MAINTRRIWITALISSLLTSCSSHQLASGNIPEEGLTVSTLYHQSTTTKPLPRLSNSKPVEKPIKKTVAHEAFKALPNPEIPLYVFPHVVQIGDEQLIKPGYTTRFFLYKQNQFALASELY
jgi:conjugative transfer region lipoprotein (TIGR03751 family)